MCCGGAARVNVVWYVAALGWFNVLRGHAWLFGVLGLVRGRVVWCVAAVIPYHSCNALMYVVQYFWAGSLKHLFWICWSVTHPWIGSESYLGGDAVLLMTKVTSRVNHPSQDESPSDLG